MVVTALQMYKRTDYTEELGGYIFNSVMLLLCSERAAKFYEQALLLVDCCRIPEAIRLLEQVCEIPVVLIKN